MFTKNRWIKTFVGISLSLAVAFAGEAWISPQPAHAATSTAAATANRIISLGERYLGTPYKYGATTGYTSSFDCSSFTQYVYRQNGIGLPRSSSQQSRVGQYVSRSNLSPGDLVFFYSPVHHVAIYIGNGKILHTYGKPGVTISSLNSSWWSSHYNTARRVIPNNGQAVTVASTSSSTSGSSAKIVRSVSFRTAPSTSSSRIRYLKSGESVRILSKVNASWYKIKDKNGRTGYVTTMKKYVN